MPFFGLYGNTTNGHKYAPNPAAESTSAHQLGGNLAIVPATDATTREATMLVLGDRVDEVTDVTSDGTIKFTTIADPGDPDPPQYVEALAIIIGCRLYLPTMHDISTAYATVDTDASAHPRYTLEVSAAAMATAGMDGFLGPNNLSGGYYTIFPFRPTGGPMIGRHWSTDLFPAYPWAWNQKGPAYMKYRKNLSGSPQGSATLSAFPVVVQEGRILLGNTGALVDQSLLIPDDFEDDYDFQLDSSDGSPQEQRRATLLSGWLDVTSYPTVAPAVLEVGVDAPPILIGQGARLNTEFDVRGADLYEVLWSAYRFDMPHAMNTADVETIWASVLSAGGE